jgi:hypothetical protein
MALGGTVGTGAAKVTPLVVRTFLQLRLPVGECAVHSNPETDATPSGVLVRIDAAAS